MWQHHVLVPQRVGGEGGGGEVQGTKLKRIVFSEHCMDITPLRGKAKRDQRLSLNSGPTL